MKRTTKQLRVRALDADVLATIDGARGTCCGTKIHCSNCGHALAATMWYAQANCCPSCGQGMNSTAGAGSAKVAYL